MTNTFMITKVVEIRDPSDPRNPGEWATIFKMNADPPEEWRKIITYLIPQKYISIIKRIDFLSQLEILIVTEERYIPSLATIIKELFGSANDRYDKELDIKRKKDEEQMKTIQGYDERKRKYIAKLGKEL
jgi:hypothetical protein